MWRGRRAETRRALLERIVRLRTPTTVLLAILSVFGLMFAARAEPGRPLFGLTWGQSAREATDAAEAKVISRALHQRYGLAYEVDRLPRPFGGEIHRILYFDDDDQLHRMWIDYGHPGGRSWEENFFLDEAITKYRELKAEVEVRHNAGECDEPELARVEEEGRVILDRRFGRNQTVWACEYERGPTHLKISMRRLGDTPGERYDVIYDARDKAAVAAYQSLHRLRRPE